MGASAYISQEGTSIALVKAAAQLEGTAYHATRGGCCASKVKVVVRAA